MPTYANWKRGDFQKILVVSSTLIVGTMYNRRQLTASEINEGYVSVDRIADYNTNVFDLY